jgi:formate hydrogenlyase transcriptional activator
LVDNFTYKLLNTPCECLTDKGTCSYSADVSKAFPKDALLREMNVQAYVGTPLFGAQGQPLGVMVALYCRPLENPALAEMILNLFSARTGAEIERKRAEDELRRVTARLHETNEELQQAKDRLTEEKLYLEQEIDTELGFGEIIGKKTGLKEVLAQVRKVAPSDSSVLLLGETGTGKEVIARAVHHVSRRKEQPFIKMNCAAIPSGLLESELFGHEKGAFTGAANRKIGRLELADGGTLFLDEIGEIPLELQPKLLRVLQDQEFERLGSIQTLKVNFRLIAATNRDLSREVAEGRFRSDLYYRLNVFPIRIPPLRERRGDIPTLVEHFVRKHAVRMNKGITYVQKKTLTALMNWNWPGNVRELENFVERAMILTQGSVLAAPLAELQLDQITTPKTLEGVEREHIIHVLRDSGGLVSGPTGAAARLGMPRTTLQSKLKKLRISRSEYRSR